MSDKQKHIIACPSSYCTEGSKLFGYVSPIGRIEFMQHPLTVTKEFVIDANKVSSPEKRFRFTSACVENGCKQWTGSACGLIDKILTSFEPPEESIKTKCPIKKNCRWYFQEGEKACGVCTYVITENFDS